MNDRIARRTGLDWSQATAAARAGVSLASYRRWEEDPDSVSAKTRNACEAALTVVTPLDLELQRSAAAFTSAWADSALLTPRQAYAIALALDMWADGELREWIRTPDLQPLHEVGPFAYFDRRVMLHVGENRAFANMTLDRCRALSRELEDGTTPFDRPGSLMDEVLIGAALHDAENYLNDMPEVFEEIPARDPVDAESEYLPGDGDWDVVSDGFDDRCRWDEWEVPTMIGHHHLPAILQSRHPFTWFDTAPATGPGYLHSLDMKLLDLASSERGQQ